MNKRNVRPDKVLRVNDMKDLSLDSIVEAYRNGYTLEGASLEQIKELERIPLQSMAVSGCQSVTISTPITVAVTNYGFIKCTSASLTGCNNFSTIPSTCPVISGTDYFNIGIEFTVANIPNPDSTKLITVNYTVNYTKNGTTNSLTLSGTINYVNGKGYLPGLYNTIQQPNFQGAVNDVFAIQSVTLTSFVLP